MSDPYNLQRFIDAQDGVIETALAELKAGSKRSHWMWLVFPQLRQLGRSPAAQHYGIASTDEARAYLQDSLLGSRLTASIEVALPWAGRRTSDQILGPVDALKFRSSLTLFDAVQPGGLFDRALAAFCGGIRDQRTLALLNAEG